MRAHVTIASSGALTASSVAISAQSWLLSSPPQLIDQATASSTGLLLLGCSSQGLDQIDLTATFQFANSATTYTAHGSAVFVCQADADNPVVVPLDILATGDIGGADVGIPFGGTTCSSTAALQGDSWLGVCASSSCDASSAVLQFSNACAGLDGASPTYWTCGAPADWTLLGPLARAQLAVPIRDGVWPLGLLAFPQMLLSPPDPTLTDASGNRRVFSAVATPRATLTVQGGVAQAPTLDATRAAAYAVLLDVPGSPSTPVQEILEIDDAPAGGSAILWTPFGACDAPAAGVALWSGLHAIDVRLQGLSAAEVILSPQVNGAASAQVLCTASAGAAGIATVTCAAPGPLDGAP